MDPRVAQVILGEMLLCSGNPNSVDHVHGEWAADRLRKAAGQVGGLFGVGGEDVRFTSSATEALRLALAHAAMGRRQGPLRVAVSTVEHPALLDMVRHAERAGVMTVAWLACDGQGQIPLETIQREVRAGAELVCLIAANNEVGTVLPLQAVADVVAAGGARLLLDASQAAGRVPLDNCRLQADYLVVSGHKLYGPSGVGALIGPDVAQARFDWPAGGHEPTPNLPGAMGLAEACRLRATEMTADEVAIGWLRDCLQAALLKGIPGLVVNGDEASRLAGNLHVSVPDAPNDQVVAQLRGKVSISTGAACASGADAPSHVLRAMGLPVWRLEGALRIGVGKFNTVEETDAAAAAIVEAVAKVRRW